MPTPEIPPEIAGRYTIERELGRGAAAVVYLAHDRRHDRAVAVKVLRAELAMSMATERFVQEVRLTAGLQHPHILPVLDSGEVGDLLYFVAPYLDGESLRNRLDGERQLSVDDALHVVRELADALHYAHGRGIIHRDIKPENVLFSGPHAYLADFGIAYAVRQAAEGRLTATGLAIGTPAYMSPEQASGDRELDARSDLYSLACVLYEMLAGVQPFVGPTPESVVAQRFVCPPRPLRAFRSGVPERVEAALARALAVAPADRPASVASFAAALGVPLPSTPERGAALVAEPVRPLSRSRRRATWLGATAAAVGLLGAAGWLTMRELPQAVAPTVALARGRAALRAGDVVEATPWLRSAADRAPRNASAQLWQAQRALLVPSDSADGWRAPLFGALAADSTLEPGDRSRAAALAALAAGRYQAACGAFRELAATDARDVTAVLSLAACLERDSAVVADSTTPSGRRFRSSLHETATAYRRALDIMPPRTEAKRSVYPRLIALLRTEWGQYRWGFASDDRRQRFAGVPALARDSLGDTLLLVPYRLSELASARPERELSSATDALAYSADVARAAAERWTREFPDDADAHASFARLLELHGDLSAARPGAPSALAETRVALAHAADPSLRLRLVVQEIRLLVKAGDVVAARQRVDSTLRTAAAGSADDRWALAALAALTGRGHLAGDLLAGSADEAEYVLPDGRPYRPRPALAESALRLFAFAAVGAPADSLRYWHARVERDLERDVAEQPRDSVRLALLARPLSIAVPVLGAAVVASVAATDIPIVRAQRALARGDRADARQALAEMRLARAAYLPGALQMDQAYQEAWLRAAVGDTTGALRQLAAVLDALPTAGASLLDDVARAAAVPRAMLLRARLAAAFGDSTSARRWSDAAAALVHDAVPGGSP